MVDDQTSNNPGESAQRHPLGRQRAKDGDGTERTITVWGARPKGERPDWGYLTTIWFAGVLLVSLAAATMYVSFEAQYTYVGQFKDDDWAVLLEALSWDVAAFAFATLGMATALRGRSALSARLGNLICVAVSVLMNSAQATAGDWGSLLVWAGPPLLYAGVSDRIIVELQNRMVERRDLNSGHTLWSVLALVLWAVVGVLGWLLRLLLAPRSTVGGFRSWYVDEVPYAPGRTEAGDRARQAELEAAGAEEVAERVRAESAEAIAAAERRADEQIAAMRAEFQQNAQEYRAAEASRSAELETAHTREVERLQTRLSEVERDREELRTTLSLAQESFSGRARVELLYEAMGQQGDVRYGDESALEAVAVELADQTGLDGRTVRRYLRDHLSKRQGAVTAGANGTNGDKMGGVQ